MSAEYYDAAKFTRLHHAGEMDKLQTYAAQVLFTAADLKDMFKRIVRLPCGNPLQTSLMRSAMTNYRDTALITRVLYEATLELALEANSAK